MSIHPLNHDDQTQFPDSSLSQKEWETVSQFKAEGASVRLSLSDDGRRELVVTPVPEKGKPSSITLSPGGRS